MLPKNQRFPSSLLFWHLESCMKDPTCLTWSHDSQVAPSPSPPIASITTSLRHGKIGFAAPELHSHQRVQDTSQLLQHHHTQAPSALSHAGSLLTPSAASPAGQEEGTEAPRTKGTDKFREYLFHPPLRFPALTNKVMLQ